MTKARKSATELRKSHPYMEHPIHCENGCGAVTELADSYASYKRNEDGNTLLICQCCAAEEGHRHEDRETPEQAPVCHRKERK